MAAPIIMADELTASGFRLAGVRTLVPTPSTLERAFEAACGDCELLLMSASLAAQLPPARLESALTADRPLLLVIPDALRRRDSPDLTRELQAYAGSRNVSLPENIVAAQLQACLSTSSWTSAAVALRRPPMAASAPRRSCVRRSPSRATACARRCVTSARGWRMSSYSSAQNPTRRSAGNSMRCCGRS